MAEKSKKKTAAAAAAAKHERILNLSEEGVVAIEEFRKSTKPKTKRWFAPDPAKWKLKSAPCTEPADLQRRATISAMADGDTDNVDELYNDQIKRVNRLRDLYEYHYNGAPEASIFLFHEDLKMAGAGEPKKKAAGAKKQKSEPQKTYLLPSERDYRIMFNFGTQRFQKNKAVDRAHVDLSAFEDNRSKEPVTDGAEPVPAIDYSRFGERVYIPPVLLRIWDESDTNKGAAQKDEEEPSKEKKKKVSKKEVVEVLPTPTAAPAPQPAPAPAKKPKSEIKLHTVIACTKLRFSNFPDVFISDIMQNHDKAHTALNSDSFFEELAPEQAEKLEAQKDRPHSEYYGVLTRKLTNEDTINSSSYVELFITDAQLPEFKDSISRYQDTCAGLVTLLTSLTMQAIAAQAPPPAPGLSEKAVAAMISKALEKERKATEKAITEQSEKTQKLIASHMEDSKSQMQDLSARLKKQDDMTAKFSSILDALMAKVEGIDKKMVVAAAKPPAPAPKQKPPAAIAATATTPAKPKPAPVVAAAAPAPAAAPAALKRPMLKRPQFTTTVTSDSV